MPGKNGLLKSISFIQYLFSSHNTTQSTNFVPGFLINFLRIKFCFLSREKAVQIEYILGYWTLIGTRCTVRYMNTALNGTGPERQIVQAQVSWRHTQFLIKLTSLELN